MDLLNTLIRAADEEQLTRLTSRLKQVSQLK